MMDLGPFGARLHFPPPGPHFWGERGGIWVHFGVFPPPPPQFRKPRRRVRRLRRRERLRADELLPSAPPQSHGDFGSRWGGPKNGGGHQDPISPYWDGVGGTLIL